jgi:ferredoxin
MGLKIDGSKCTGCGACRDVCPERAITMRDDLAVINEKSVFSAAHALKFAQ